LLTQVEIKRTIPKGSVQSSSKDFKTKKIFVGGLPSTLTEGNISMAYDVSALFYIDFALMIVLFVNLDQTISRVSLQDMGLW
jgi:hypothetical protein